MCPGLFGRRLVKPHKVSVADGEPAEDEILWGCLGFLIEWDNGKFFTRHWRGEPGPGYDISRTGMKSDSREM